LSDVDLRILAVVAEHGPIKTVKLMALTDLSRSHLLRRTEVLTAQGFLQRSQNSPTESYEFWVQEPLVKVIEHEKRMRENDIIDELEPEEKGLCPRDTSARQLAKLLLESVTAMANHKKQGAAILDALVVKLKAFSKRRD